MPRPAPIPIGIPPPTMPLAPILKPAISGFPAQDLGDHFLQLPSPGDAVAVSSMRADDIVVRPQGCTNSGRYCLFTEIGMEITDNQTLPIKLDALGLKNSNGVNRTIKSFKKLT